MDHYEDLTEQLARAGFRISDDGRTVGLTPRVERLLRERRALVEQADSKLVCPRTGTSTDESEMPSKRP